MPFFTGFYLCPFMTCDRQYGVSRLLRRYANSVRKVLVITSLSSHANVSVPLK